MDPLIEQLNSLFNPVDYIVLCFWVIWTLKGLIRGLSGELAGLIGTLLVFFGGWRLYTPLGNFIAGITRIEDENLSRLVAFVLTVIVLVILLGLLYRLLKRVFEFAFTGLVERLGGMLTGLAKAVIITAIILLGINLTGHEYLRKHCIEESWFGAAMQQHIPAWVSDLRLRLLPEADKKPDAEKPGEKAPASSASPGKEA